MRLLLAVFVAVLGIVLGPAAVASADGGPVGADIQVAQTLGDRELTVIIRRVDTPPAPLRVDVVTHAGTPAGRLELRASTAGETVSTTRVELGATPGFHSGTLRVDRAGPWELTTDDGVQEATIPFVVPALVQSPWERATYGGFVAAGALLLIALGLAVFGRAGFALVPAGGMVAALAVAVTAGLLAPVLPELDTPHQRTSSGDLSRPPVNLVTSMRGADLRLQLTDGTTGRPVDDLLIHHNAFLHLMVVSPSGGMDHLHPIRVAPGDYRARLDPVEVGVHAVGVELARRGGGVQLVRSSVRVDTATAAPARQGDAELTEVIRPAGTPSTIAAAFGSPDLQPWLGMLGHLIVVGPVDDLRSPECAPIWAHVHAMVPQTRGFPDKPDESVAAFGPDVRFTYTFPLPGRYLAWIQAERDYAVITVPTVIDVPAAESTTVTGRTGQYTVDLTADRPKQGANMLDFEVIDAAGRPATVDTIGVEFVMPQMGHALPPVSATRTEPGRYRASNIDIPMSGAWEVTVSLPGDEDVVLTLLVT
jgi:hypothetical protein